MIVAEEEDGGGAAVVVTVVDDVVATVLVLSVPSLPLPTALPPLLPATPASPRVLLLLPPIIISFPTAIRFFNNPACAIIIRRRALSNSAKLNGTISTPVISYR